MDVVGDEGNHSGSIELMMDVLNCLGNAQVASKVVIMTGVEDIQSDILVIGNIE